MDYDTARGLAGTWGMILLIVGFLAACWYALRPGNRKRFEDAAKIPFKED